MSLNSISHWFDHSLFMPIIRTVGHYGLALVAALTPSLGENHLLVAGVLAFGFGPAAFWLSARMQEAQRSVAEPFVDMLTLLVVVFALPELWHPALLVGAVIAQAPSIALNQFSFRIYTAASVLLLLGMTVIAYFREVENWVLPISVLSAVFPSTLLYALSMGKKAQGIRSRAEALSSLQLVSGGIAHDFNNILTSITGYAYLASSGGADPEGIQRALEKIIGSTEKAGRLTHQLISFAGDKKTEYRDVDFCQEIRGVVDLMEGSVPEGVNVRLSLPSTPVYVSGDAVQLSQVVLNLLVNAVESIDLTGTIHVRLEMEDDFAELEIEDNGSGVQDSQLSTMFEPFVSSKPNGHGLGLAVVKNILDQHGAMVKVQSTLAVGTKFSIQFPLSLDPPETSISNVKQCVLIADDEAAIRVILRQVFESSGFEVLEASDGNQFMTLFGQHRDKLCAVTLDVKMPGKTGWQCLDLIRETMREFPVLMISGYDPEAPSSKHSDHFMTFISKPFRIADIKKSLSTLLDAQGQNELEGNIQ